MEGAIIMESTLAQNCFIFFQRAGIRSSSSQKNCRLVWLKEEIERGRNKEQLFSKSVFCGMAKRCQGSRFSAGELPRELGNPLDMGLPFPMLTHNMNSAIIAGFDAQNEISCWLYRNIPWHDLKVKKGHVLHLLTKCY